jgi:hypothetical protein
VYSEKADKLKTLAAVHEGRVKAFKNDAAAASDAFLGGKAGETPEALAGARLNAQEKNGVPVGARKPLTNAEAAALHEEWTHGDLQARLVVGARLQQYGRHAALVAQQAGLGPAEQLALRQADSHEGLANLKTLITAGSMKKEQLPALGTEESDTKLARQVMADSEVAKGYAALGKALPGFKPALHIRAGLEKTAVKLLRMNGGDVEATRKLIDGRLASLHHDNFALVYDGKAIDGRYLEKGLRKHMGKKLADFLEAGQEPALSIEERFTRQDRLADLRQRGVWANAPDGNGYALFDPTIQGPLRDGKGRIFLATDKDLLEDASAIAPLMPWDHLP